MPITTLSSREFNQDASKAKRAAKSGPVFITDRGRTALVLLSFDEYKKITGGHARIADSLAMPGCENIELETAEFEAPKSRDPARPADLS
jgi:hypothetical protein